MRCHDDIRHDLKQAPVQKNKPRPNLTGSGPLGSIPKFFNNTLTPYGDIARQPATIHEIRSDKKLKMQEVYTGFFDIKGQSSF